MKRRFAVSALSLAAAGATLITLNVTSLISHARGPGKNVAAAPADQATISLKEQSQDWGGWCGTTPRTAAQILRLRRDLALLKRQRGSAARGPAARGPALRGAGTVRVPVYVHVIQRADGTGAMPDYLVYGQIKALNIAFAGRDLPAAQSGQGPSAQPTANTPFRFVLGGSGVTRTPNGTPIVNGISRTVNDTWFDMTAGSTQETEAKTALKVGRGGTLNLYLCNPGSSLLGYAYLPFSGVDNFVRDGVVMLYSSVPGGSAAPYNYGDTATHEVGHWLGMEHTFQGGCNADPVNGGDLVSDTPAESMPHYGRVPPYPDTCTTLTGRDPAENYMDYSDDDVLFQFTPGQSNLMDDQHLAFRGNL